MKILFSEATPDYDAYVFPYAVWGFLEPTDTIESAFERGFLPSLPDFSRFYLGRSARVSLSRFCPSSENRRVMRKGETIQSRLLPRAEFDYTAAWRDFCLNYSTQRFGENAMTRERLDRLFETPIVSHLLVYSDTQTNQDIGLCLLYIDNTRFAYYYFAFYDLNYPLKSLGAYMMTSAIIELRESDARYVYLGTVYSRSALYKSQFKGFEFFNGIRWSDNIKELKAIIDRQTNAKPTGHLLEQSDYVELYHNNDLQALTAKAPRLIPSEASESEGHDER